MIIDELKNHFLIDVNGIHLLIELTSLTNLLTQLQQAARSKFLERLSEPSLMHSVVLRQFFEKPLQQDDDNDTSLKEKSSYWIYYMRVFCLAFI